MTWRLQYLVHVLVYVYDILETMQCMKIVPIIIQYEGMGVKFLFHCTYRQYFSNLCTFLRFSYKVIYTCRQPLTIVLCHGTNSFHDPVTFCFISPMTE